MQECFLSATRRNISVVLLSEPYVGAKAHLSAGPLRVIQKQTNNRDKPVRAAVVLVDPNLEIIENSELVSETIAACIVKKGRRRIGVVSVYLDKLLDIDADITNLLAIIAKLNTEDIIIGGDVNASSTWWGCQRDGRRGLSYMDFILQANLHVLNEGSTPTFHTYRGDTLCTSIVDVTVSSASLLDKVTTWKVHTDVSTLSDHRWVEFEITCGRTNTPTARTSTRIFNTKKADWPSFRAELVDTLEQRQITVEKVSETPPSEIDNLIEQYTTAIRNAISSTCPMIPVEKPYPKINWWTPDLTTKKTEVVRARRSIGKANQRRRPKVISDYLKLREEYKIMIQDARTESWKAFCTGETKETVWQRSYRVLKICNKNKAEQLLRPSPNDHLLTPRDSADLLAASFFPLDDTSTDTEEQQLVRRAAAQVLNVIDSDGEYPDDGKAFQHCELIAVYGGMSPKKSPGADGLTSDICHWSYIAHPDLQLAIFNLCLLQGYFPKMWKAATIKIIPKPGKEDYSVPKSYRPIGLLPVLGKVMEKMIAIRISWSLGSEGRLSPRQYGFVPQVGTEDALYDAIQLVKTAVKAKKIVAIASLDIEGAFDNCWWPLILKQLYQKRVDKTIMRVVTSYLNDRCISLRYLGEDIARPTNKGCVQGSICGPLFWNIQMDPLMKSAESLEAHIQAFADDILIVAAGDTGLAVEQQMNAALKVVSDWGRSAKLRFAIQKTQAVVITRKLKFDTPRIVFDDCQVTFSDSIKILGLIIDKSLTFAPHLENVVKKSVNIHKMLTRAVKTSWGLNPDITRLLYIAAVEPVILYASSVWAAATNRDYFTRNLNRLTRMFALSICRAHRTTSMAASALLARIIPLDLRARENAALYELKRGRPLDTLPGRELEARISPFDLPHPAERKRLSFASLNSEDDVSAIVDAGIKLFTDGSKIEGKVGAAVSCWPGELQTHSMKYKLADYCSVFQAELVAILGAAEFMVKRKIQAGNIISDSRSALEAICDQGSENPLAYKIRTIITSHKINLGLFWVKAHIGIQGNEAADELAKEAALKSKVKPTYDAFPLSFARRTTRQATLDAWQRKYTEDVAGETTKLFFPDVKKAYQILNKLKITTLRTQLFTGHCGLRSYLYRFKLLDTPFCTCDDQSAEDILHVLLNCPKYDLGRLDCEQELGSQILQQNLHKIVDDDDTRSVFLEYAEKALYRAVRANGSTLSI